MRRLVLAPLAVLTALALGGCGDDATEPAADPTAPTAGPTPTAAVTEPTATADTNNTTEPAAVAPTATPQPGAGADDADELFPDVLAVDAARSGDGTWRFDVTLSSPYDTPARYADAWRVLALDGTELGVRVLAHDHASEQPFTRSLAGVEIPDDVTTVTVEGRDQVSGWGGDTVTIELPDA